LCLGKRGRERIEEEGTPAASGRAALDLAVAGEQPAAGCATPLSSVY
jgi:hypothetical protein